MPRALLAPSAAMDLQVCPKEFWEGFPDRFFRTAANQLRNALATCGRSSRTTVRFVELPRFSRGFQLWARRPQRQNSPRGPGEPGDPGGPQLSDW